MYAAKGVGILSHMRGEVLSQGTMQSALGKKGLKGRVSAMSWDTSQEALSSQNEEDLGMSWG